MFRRIDINEAEKDERRGSERATRNGDPFWADAVGEVADEGAGEGGDGKTHEDEAGVEGGPGEKVFDVEGEDAVEGGEDGDVDEDAVDGSEEAGDGEEEEDGGGAAFGGFLVGAVGGEERGGFFGVVVGLGVCGLGAAVCMAVAGAAGMAVGLSMLML